MAGTAEMLRTTLGASGYAMLRAVAGHTEPASGRAIASELAVSPTTASTRLHQLELAGFVRSTKSGRSVLWRLNTDNEVMRAWLRENRSAAGATMSDAGASPVSTGGGGVTFERKVAASYLAQLLLGHGSVGLGPGRAAVSVAFQQAPEFTVDDLAVTAVGKGESEPSLVLLVAARRTPNVVDSDENSQKLFRSFVQQVLNIPTSRPEVRLALAVAGPQDHAEQLAVLVRLAADQPGPEKFFGLVRTPKKFDKAVRERLVQVEKLVGRALVDLAMPDPSKDRVEKQVWELLSRLVVLTPRLENTDDPDWSTVANSLIPMSRGQDLYGGTLLRDRLLVLADDWAPTAASVNMTMLRRAVHDLMDSRVRRHRDGWRALDLLSEQARAAVGDAIVSADGARRVQVDRADVTAALTAAVGSAAKVVLHGESGVGKSAAALCLLTTTPIAAKADGAPADADGACESQILCLNLRHLPRTTLGFEGLLRSPLGNLLAEMSAPTRLLVVDGADAVVEGAQDLLTYVVGAAASAGVTVVAVTASDAKQLVVDTVAGAGGWDVVEVAVPPLTDSQIDVVVSEFGELEPMAASPRSRELLRRPVVVDLLVRGGVRGVPVSDYDAMQQVWSGLVRRNGATDQGTPDARDIAMQLLARQALRGGDQLDVAAKINPDALAGLRKDGLLRTSQDNPFRLVPEFAHDEVRRYAVARLLLAGGAPISALVDAGVPRWALGAARLACQALLVAPGSALNPVAGRFLRWQKEFDGLVVAGHGERWSDVPGEALLTLGDPRPLLREAWPWLQTPDRIGMERLIRLVDQRLRGQNTLVRVAAVEPLVELLLEDEAPWRSGTKERTLLLEWLRALVVSNTPAGYMLRERMRDQLLQFCAAADERLRTDEETKRARLSDDQRAALQDTAERLSVFRKLGLPRSRRRQRSGIPMDVIDETVVELFALLGPDLGVAGEAVLRRIADAAPEALAPAVEGVACGRGLAGYRQGFLAELVLAYYLDENSGYGYEDGVRRHHDLGLRWPRAVWYRGPFASLFYFDFRNGVSVLNRILNHAAAVRAGRLARRGRSFELMQDSDLDQYHVELDITGAPHVYVGAPGMWNWYRGTGVGPYPCMSALQALERTCDDLVGSGMPLDVIVPILLDGCDNVAMVGLVVGVLVRHLEKAGTLLDRFLAEHDVWRFESARVANEVSGLKASSEGIGGVDRREWSMREVAAALVLAAGTERTEELRLVGQQLVAKLHRQLELLGDAIPAAATEMELSTTRLWASFLDRSTYSMHRTDDGIVIENHPPAEVTAALSDEMNGVLRSQESIRLAFRYHVKQQAGTGEPIAVEDLVADLECAEELFNEPAGLDTTRWDALAAVAAYALTQHLVHGLPLPADSLKLAADIVVRVGEGDMPQRAHDYEDSYFSQGSDRIAARVLPLLLIPSADHLRRILDGTGGYAADARIEAAVARLACSNVLETRLFLARGLDHIWAVSCNNDATCPHHVALRIAIETMRDSVLGLWNMEKQERSVEILDDPIVDTLPAVANDSIYVSRLDAAIRSLGTAAAANICVSQEARVLVDVLLDAQRRALLAPEHGDDDRGTHSLVAARALLIISDDDAILTHICAYLDDSDLLDQALQALSAAAEEDDQRAETARRVWPRLVARVLDAHDEGHKPFTRNYHDRDYALAALLPTPAGETTYLYSEVNGKPTVWWDPTVWQTTVDRWLDIAAGKPTCVDNLVRFVVSSLPVAEQARIGVPWVARSVLADSGAIAGRCYSLTSWLIEIRTAADEAGLSRHWQRTVDALVVAGNSRLAPYSE